MSAKTTGSRQITSTVTMTLATGNFRSKLFVRTPNGETATLRRPSRAEPAQTRARKTTTTRMSQAGMSMFAYPMGSPMKWM